MPPWSWAGAGADSMAGGARQRSPSCRHRTVAVVRTVRPRTDPDPTPPSASTWPVGQRREALFRGSEAAFEPEP